MKRFMDHAKAISKRVMDIQATLLLSLVYLLCMPFLKFASFGTAHEASGWITWTLKSDTLTDVQGQ